MMRNSTGGTSTSAKKSHNTTSKNDDEKNSAKKLVQARLPFKVIAPGSSPTIAAEAATTPNERDALKEGKKDARKRKLSYESEENDTEIVQEVDNVSKENVEIKGGATVKKKKITSTNNEDEVECISLLDDEQEDLKNSSRVDTSSSKAGSTLKTPKTGTKGKSKGAGTPQPTVTPGSEHKGKGGGNNTKLQIKLPLSAGKRNKRRKSKANNSLANTSALDSSMQNNSCADSCDDIEEISGELNPQKRTKLDYDEGTQKQTNDTAAKDKESIPLEIDSSSDECNKSEKATESRKTSTEVEAQNEHKKSEKNISKSIKGVLNPSSENKKILSKKDNLEESIVIESDDNRTIDDDEENEDDDDDDDEDADDERDNNVTAKISANTSSDNNEVSNVSKHNTTIESIRDEDGLKNKNLTPKQKKLLEQRQKAREEKERKLQEEKRKKQQEKEEKELAKKREREEKEEQKRKEREEKEEQKRKEREEKERKRLAEIEAKNEEKRKRNEAKEEELRKKDEERKRKEQEKEEAELKKKKAAEAFTKFFVAKTPATNQQNVEDDENTGDGTKSLAFRPFQIKGDMKLAPISRKILSEEAKSRVDHLLGLHGSADEDDEKVVRVKPLPKSKLYLSELRSGQILPGKWRRPSTDSKDDVVIVEDELERVGEAIVEDTPAYIREEMRVKFYKFHDNRRPPYYGTWRKKSKVITGRKPFAQDTKFCDYEVDSDDEWEEEEPGESLEDGSDDDKEKESEDDDYEVDNEWFVPHGHLSEEEMQNEDELGEDCNDREAQKAKLKIIQQEFAQEMKKKTEKIKPRLIGCIWIDSSGRQPTSCPSIIWDKLNTRAMLCSDPPILEEPEIEDPPSPSASNSGCEKSSTAVEKIKPVTITEAMVKDLVKLLHGNNKSKVFLIKEFIAYISKTEESVINGEFANPLKSAIREKIDSMAEWQVVEAQPQTADDLNESLKKKKKTKKRLCWVVNKETLDKLDMSSLSLTNDWEYTLTPKLKADKGENTKLEEDGNPKSSGETVEMNGDSKSHVATVNNIVDIKESKTKSVNSPITKFAQVLTKAEEKANKDVASSSTNCNTSPKSSKDSSNKRTAESKTKTSPSPVNKEKKRVSLGRSQQAPTPAKNKLISQFLQKGSNKKAASSPSTATKRNPNASIVVDDDDDVVILD